MSNPLIQKYAGMLSRNRAQAGPPDDSLPLEREGDSVKFIDNDGDTWWFKNAGKNKRYGWYRAYGEIHRIKGPALIIRSSAFYKQDKWCRNGKFHREDGPAYIDYTNGKEGYCLNGVSMSRAEHEQCMKVKELVKKGSKEAGVNLDV